MWARSCCLLALAACYSATAQTGAPCNPSLDNCPRGQTCEPFDGDFFCMKMPGSDPDGGPNDDVNPGGEQPISMTMWTLLQTRSRMMADDVTFNPTGTGNLIIAAVETSDNSLVTGVSDNANNSYVQAPGSRSVNNTEGFGVEFWYARDSLPGATRITATAPTVYAVAMWEVAGMNRIAPLGNINKVDNQGPSPTPFGAPITTTTMGEFVVSIAIVETTVDGLVPGTGFTNDHLAFGNGWAHLTSRTAPPNTYQAQWDQGANGVSCTSSVAFRRP